MVNNQIKKQSIKSLLLSKLFTSVILVLIILGVGLVFAEPKQDLEAKENFKPLEYYETLTSLQPVNLELIKYYQTNPKEYKKLSQQNKIVLGGQWFNYWRNNK